MFQKSVLNSIKQDESLVALRWAEYQKFLAKVEYIKTVKEEKYQDGFLKDIFENCLGYTLDMTDPSNFNLEREKKNETDGKKADGVIYVDKKIVGVIELKAQDTKNLDKIEAQAFNYHASHSNSKYIIISNFDELRFYIDKKTAYEQFYLFKLDYEEFKKLHLLISYESIKNDIPLKLKEKTSNFEQNISKELYKDFSIFRNSLFENIVSKNTDIEKSTLLRLTQKLCDRIIFILFAEDRGLLTSNTISEIRYRHSQDGFGDRSMYDYYKLYFNAINDGNERLNIPKYNGGLFSKDDLLDSLKIDDTALDMEAQKLSDYDFESDISVNILGHIFEQSLTDLEELQSNIDNVDFDKTKSKRKKDGVFYTPEYITKYIVDNTLGKMCLEKREELNLLNITAPINLKKLTKTELEIKNNLEIYKDWLFNLKILDPACGSGAFLNQALEYLIKEHKQLQYDLALMGDLFYSYTVEESVLEHNLYGVDINEDAVEIAKLSLWLRTAKKGRPLTNLANKIKCGNSLISDKSVVENAFVWEEEFKEVFESGGFDIVIGNPPYVDNRGFDKNILKYYFGKYINSFGKSGIDNFKTTKFNLIAPFIELTYKLLSNNGLTSFIIHKNIFKTNSYCNIRKFILNNYNIKSLTDWGSGQFQDVVAETATFIFEKNKCQVDRFKIEFYKLNNKVKESYEFQDTYLKNYDYIFSIYTIESDRDILIKIKNNSLSLENILNINNGIVTGNDKKYLYNKKDKDFLKPIIRGKDISRYSKIVPSEYIEYNKENLLRARDENIFLANEKLIMQMINTQFVITFDSDKIYNLGTTYALTLKNLNFNIKFILSVMSSKLLNWYYKKQFTNESELTNAISTKNLFEIPIKEISLKEQEPFIQKADLMLELNKKLQETKQNFFNELKLEKLTTKLQKFEELEFDDFIKEYTKSKKIKFADKLEERNFKNDWKALFENDKKEVLGIQNQINQTDKEIDNIVYKLYDLTQDEIKIVEGME